MSSHSNIENGIAIEAMAHRKFVDLPNLPIKDGDFPVRKL
jgi:hypothetical protein